MGVIMVYKPTYNWGGTILHDDGSWSCAWVTIVLRTINIIYVYIIIIIIIIVMEVPQ